MKKESLRMEQKFRKNIIIEEKERKAKVIINKEANKELT
jgi:hypothetical protein